MLATGATHSYFDHPEWAPLAPGLYVVSTPIGNLRDLTFRALDVLNAADLVLAEDTRVAGKLMAAYGLSKKLQRYDDHSDDQARTKILALVAAGGKIALVSDAGTPLISDPGYRLVHEAAAAGLTVVPIPGASAPMAAMAGAGSSGTTFGLPKPTDRFLFMGFTPVKSGPRRSFFSEVAGVRATLIFYETGPRLADSLADMLAVYGPREAAVCRELTKLYETFVRGPLDSLVADPALQLPKGEIVVLVEADADRALTEALARLSPADAAQEVARALGLPRRELYRRALALKAAP